jgi:hypothetical protein
MRSCRQPFESNHELVAKYGNITVFRNVLMKEAVTWCSNIQSPDDDLRHKPCRASENTGSSSMVNGPDYKACVEVSVSATLCGQPWLGIGLAPQVAVNKGGVFCLEDYHTSPQQTLSYQAKPAQLLIYAMLLLC